MRDCTQETLNWMAAHGFTLGEAYQAANKLDALLDKHRRIASQATTSVVVALTRAVEGALRSVLYDIASSSLLDNLDLESEFRGPDEGEGLAEAHHCLSTCSSVAIGIPVDLPTGLAFAKVDVLFDRSLKGESTLARKPYALYSIEVDPGDLHSSSPSAVDGASLVPTRHSSAEGGESPVEVTP